MLLGAGAIGYWTIDHIASRPTARAGDPMGNFLSQPPPHRDVGAHSQGLDPTNDAALVASTNPSYSPKPTRIRSALEGSPGYYPPADPESLSEIMGRREAPEVDGELSGGATSLDELARALVSGVQRKDVGSLHALRVTRSEFETFLWPEFPQSRPITHIPVSEAWGFLTANCLAGANRTTTQYGGRPLTFVRVDYGRSVPYRNFTLYREVLISVRDTRNGQVVPLRFAPSIVERRGKFKALTFKD